MYRFISDIIGKSSPAYTQSMQIEFLQLTALIVHFKGYDFDPQTHKKEIIRFAWSHFKNEDITAKQSAYLLICRFIEVYETPDKIILQVYVALLKSYQPEAKQLVRDALDIMTPTLDKKFVSQDPPHWIKWTRKVIIEDGHSLPLLIHVLQLIVRHTDIFYKYRGQFVQHISNSLARIGLLPNSAPENKKLACNLVELIINWEKRRIEEAKNATEAPTSVEVKQEPTPMAVDESGASDSQGGTTPNAAEAASSGPQPPYVPPPTTIEMVVNFVTRMAATPDPKDPTSAQVASYALDLLREALALWPTVNIKFAFFEKLLSPTADQPHYVITSLNILNVILTFQQKSFLATNITALQTSLLPAIASDNMKITEALAPVLKKIISEYSTSIRATLDLIFKRIGELLEQGVNAEKHNIFNLLYLFKSIVEPSTSSDVLSPYLPHLIKMMMRLAKEHFAPPQETVNPGSPSPGQPPGAQAKRGSMPPQQQKRDHIPLLRSLQLCASQIDNPALVPELRRNLLHAVYLLIDKTLDVSLNTIHNRCINPNDLCRKRCSLKLL
jgi:transformation/transcription domain-associated protein